MKIVAVLSGVLFSASLSCTKHVNGCDSNADCTDPAYPFCDVNGAYPPSDGTKNICTITPPGCPADVCGCAPGAATCGSGELTTCNADGSSTTTTSCALGCGSDGLACASFTPSNGLAPILTEASAEPDVSIPSGTTINTDDGTIMTSGGMSLMIANSLVVQANGIPIRALAAHSFTIADVTVVGASPIAFVAATDIALNGILDVSANGSVSGPGASTTCDGDATVMAKCSNFPAPASPCSGGAGGGGNATAGGSGGVDALVIAGEVTFGGSNDGGPPLTGFSPLLGGCSGGSGTNAALFVAGGGGGGAVQLVSGATIELVGIIDVGGGGWSAYPEAPNAGGGAGGMVIIETPQLTIANAGGFAANGGGGAGCTLGGSDGAPNDSIAAGGDDGSCSGSDYSLAGGNGGTGSAMPGNGGFDTRGSASAGESDGFGGGGGASGRVRIATGSGGYSAMPTSIQSGVITTATLSN